MHKAALLATLLLALSGATKPAKPEKLGPGELYPQIHQVTCDEGSGTAFDSDLGALSVAHVTDLTNCRIADRPIIALKAGDKDFSTIPTEKVRNGFRVNCEGFVPGQYYFAVGYARGYKWQTMVMLMATTERADGQVMLIGPRVIPGMSGGPVLSAEGKVVGTVNRYDRDYPRSFSQPLSDTSVCKDHAHV